MKSPILRGSAALAIALACSLAPKASALDVGNAWVARLSNFKGDLSCHYGDPDCNRCVYDVEGQFRAMTRDGKMRERVDSWYGGDEKPPANNSIEDYVQLNPDGSTHFQSIARAPSSSPNLVVTHGADSGKAGVFLVEAEERADGRLRGGTLQAVHRGATMHAGGAQGIGERFIVANDEGGTYMQFVDAADSLAPSVNQSLPVAGKGAAAVAATRLRGGGYVFATLPDSKNNQYEFWYTPSLSRPSLERVSIGFTTSEGQPDFNLGEGAAGIEEGNSQGFEGVSFVTECGTGDVFMIGVQGNSGLARNDGVWTLHRLAYEGRPQLTYVTRNTRDMHTAGCNTRAGGSAFAGKYGQLGLYCGQKGRDERDRPNAFLCGAEVVLAVSGHPIAAFVMESIGAFFDSPPCTRLALGDDDIVYTEYWSNAPTPELPPEHVAGTVKLTVEVNNLWSGTPDGGCIHASGCVYAENLAIIAIDETPAISNDSMRIEQCAPGTGTNRKMCNFYIRAGARVRIVADTSGHEAFFTDSQCSLQNPASPGPTATCDLVMSGPKTVGASCSSLI